MLSGGGKSTNHGVALGRSCEAARHRYLKDVEAWDGDEDAIFNSEPPVVSPFAPVHDRRCTMQEMWVLVHVLTGRAIRA